MRPLLQELWRQFVLTNPRTPRRVLQGYGPAFDVDVATNRILGILIGNVVVTIVFLWLWPVSVSAGTALHLGRAVEGLAAGLRRAGQNLAGIMPELDAARRLSRLSAFEASRLRIRSPPRQRMHWARACWSSLPALGWSMLIPQCRPMPVRSWSARPTASRAVRLIG